MKVTVTLHVDPREAHDEGIENCVKWAVMDGLMEHFEFFRPELDPEAIYEYMRARGFYVESVTVAQPERPEVCNCGGRALRNGLCYDCLKDPSVEGGE